MGWLTFVWNVEFCQHICIPCVHKNWRSICFRRMVLSLFPLLDLNYNACICKFPNEDGYWMESVWGSKGGQLIYLFIVDNNKYMGNNNGGHGWCCSWSTLQWVDNLGMMNIINGLLAYYKKEMCVHSGFTKEEICALSARAKKCTLVKLQHFLCLWPSLLSARDRLFF